jgi:hypothetical protein
MIEHKEIHIIAHRANLNGENKLTENHPDQILLCLSKGYDCEIDIWFLNNNLYLGHDEPQYEVSLNFILDNVDKLWCHCKHMESFQYLLTIPEINCFYHQTDDYILTSHLYIWTYPGKIIPDNRGIVVMPEWNKDIKYNKDSICGICTDFPENIDMFLFDDC